MLQRVLSRRSGSVRNCERDPPYDGPQGQQGCGKEAKLLHLSLPHPINRAREVVKTLMCVHLGSALVTRDEFVNLLMV